MVTDVTEDPPHNVTKSDTESSATGWHVVEPPTTMGVEAAATPLAGNIMQPIIRTDAMTAQILFLLVSLINLCSSLK
jgi:hypothetical protein